MRRTWSTWINEALRLTTGMLVLAILGMAGWWWLIQGAEEEQKSAWEVHKTEVRLGPLAEAQARVQFFFKNVYETGRTISLIPGVRAVKGPNRTSFDQDVVATKRMDSQTDVVIKNLYLNLAGNFAISEIYCVLEGLDSQQGQVPFFMYDQTIVPQGADTRDAADIPPPIEDEEYAYFPTVLAALKSSNPTFSFGFDLASIPVAYSPVMGTCDNTQYLSLKSGDRNHTRGMISSIPLYAPDGEFKGLIAVIYRTDTLVAVMLNLPFLPITEADQERAQDLHFDWPSQVAPLVLSGPNGVLLADPRSSTLLDTVKAAREAKNPDLLETEVSVPGSRGWTMSYWASPEEQQGVLKALKENLEVRQWALLVMVILLGIVWFLMWNGRRRREGLLAQLTAAIDRVGEGDLGAQLVQRSITSGSVAVLSEAFATMKSSISAMVTSLKRSLETSSSVSSDLASSSAEASATLDEIRHAVDGITKVTAELGGLITDTMDAIFQHSQAEGIVRNQVTALDQRLNGTAAFVEESLSSFHAVASTMARQTGQITTLQMGSRDARNRMHNATTQLDLVQKTVDHISETVAVISDITAKTKLLAMNAAIEAAHAGTSGRGFAVVSQNIRGLAEETETQSKAIDENLADLVRTLAGAREAQQWTGEHLAQLLDDFELLGSELTAVSSNMEDLAEGSHEILDDLGKTKQGSQLALESIDKMGLESEKLVEKIQVLVSMAQTTTKETQELQAAILQVGEVVQMVSDAGSRNLESVEVLVSEAERFHD